MSDMSDEMRQVATEAAENAVRLARVDIEESVDKGVTNALTRMGMDPSEPQEMQRDFQFLRDFRDSVASVKRKSVMTVIGILVTATLAALWIGFQSYVAKP